MKILLVDAIGPWLAQTPQLRDLEQVVLPVGLMSLAAAANQRFGDRVDVQICHTVADCESPAEIEQLIRNSAPDLVGIRGLHIYRELFRQIVTSARDAGVPLIAGGGPYPTSDPETVMKQCDLDIAILGEGEQSFVELLDCLLADRDYDELPGLAVGKNGAITINPARPVIANLDNLPDPDYRTIDFAHYDRFLTYGYNRRRQGVILSSRGCPYRCAYCHTIFGKKFRMRSADRVVNEIVRLHQDYGIEDFFIVDDVFNLDIERLSRFCNLMKASGLDVRLYFSNGLRGDILTPELIDRLVAAGMVWITFALETATPRLQKLIHKNTKLDKLRANIRHACDAGIMTSVCFMIGFPTETKDEAWQTIEYVKQFDRLVLPMFFSVKYYPDTAIFQMAQADGFDLERSDKAYDETYHDISHSGTPHISSKDFQELYFRFLREVFLSEPRLRHALEVQRKFCSEQEIMDMYSLFFRRRVRDLERDVLKFARS